jgi:hypothetical protein
LKRIKKGESFRAIRRGSWQAKPQRRKEGSARLQRCSTAGRRVGRFFHEAGAGCLPEKSVSGLFLEFINGIIYG